MVNVYLQQRRVAAEATGQGKTAGEGEGREGGRGGEGRGGMGRGGEGRGGEGRGGEGSWTW